MRKRVNHEVAAEMMSDFILEMTDPDIPRWKKEQLEILGRHAAQNYRKKVGKE